MQPLNLPHTRKTSKHPTVSPPSPQQNHSLRLPPTSTNNPFPPKTTHLSSISTILQPPIAFNQPPKTLLKHQNLHLITYQIQRKIYFLIPKFNLFTVQKLNQILILPKQKPLSSVQRQTIARKQKSNKQQT